MEHIDVDTTYLTFDINDPKFHDIICNAIPSYKKYEDEYMKTDEARTRLFRWIVLMFDRNTPLRREVTDYYKRKVYAGNLVGIKPNAASGKYKSHVEDILVGQDKKVNDLIIKFISYQADPEYTQLFGHYAMLHSILDKIISGKADTNTQKAFDASNAVIKELTNSIYGTGERNEVTEARRALYKQIAYDLNDMRSENVARRMAAGDGLPDEWSPYESGYRPDSIKFVGDDVSVAREDEEQLPV